MAARVPYVEPWADREILFDITPKQLELVPGEVLIDALGDIEDTKGNNGDHGACVLPSLTAGHLSVTNLRLIWESQRRSRINLYMSFDARIKSIKTAHAQRLRGTTRALYIMAKMKDTRYQFIFTNVLINTPRLFTTVLAVHRAFESAPLYRNIKLRGAILQDKQLIVLRHEEVYQTIDGVWNLANDAGTLGVMILTNIRVVWYAQANELFNVSAPYLHIKRELKFGKSMVLKTSMANRGFVLGFRIDPEDRVLRKVMRLREVYLTSPIYGVDYEITAEVAPPPRNVDDNVDDVTIVPQKSTDACAAYFVDNEQRDELGLAIEPLRTGVTLDSLWAVQ